jgi:hypothetical protein
LGQDNPAFSIFCWKNDLKTKSWQLNFSAVAFLKSIFLWLVALLSAERGFVVNAAKYYKRGLNPSNLYAVIGI